MCYLMILEQTGINWTWFYEVEIVKAGQMRILKQYRIHKRDCPLYPEVTAGLKHLGEKEIQIWNPANTVDVLSYQLVD